MSTPTRLSVWGALVAAFGLSLAMPATALAQRDAGSKIRGDYNFYSSQSGRRITSARNYAQDLHAYVAGTPKPNPAIVKEMTTEIGRNLDEAKKHLGKMKKEAAGDKATVAAIEKIEQRLTAAFDHHMKLCDCCKDADFKRIDAMECCDDLAAELDQIAADHGVLMRKLAGSSAVK
ncbi:MAG: hypothetical protein WD063_10980 [Pirellulales bacterium]